MKGRFEIKTEILKREKALNALKDKYYGLHQIDMGSGEGNQVRAEMNKMQGGIDAMNWVLES